MSLSNLFFFILQPEHLILSCIMIVSIRGRFRIYLGVRSYLEVGKFLYLSQLINDRWLLPTLVLFLLSFWSTNIFSDILYCRCIFCVLLVTKTISNFNYPLNYKFYQLILKVILSRALDISLKSLMR